MHYKLVFVFIMLLSPVLALELKEVQEMSGKVLPGTKSVTEMKQKDTVYYTAFDDLKKQTGYIFITSVRGYKDMIRVISGFNNEGKVVNYLLNHSETKEYYMLVKKSDFKERCLGKKKNELTMKSADNKTGKIDTVTGATITCQAIIYGLQEAAEIFEKIQKDNVKK